MSGSTGANPSGVGLFLLASAFSGGAKSMEAMIFYRLLQDIGAGAIMPVTLTIVDDLYPGPERGKVQGYLASVWAACGVLGPLVGSVIVEHWSWSWIFWMNVPIGIAAAFGFIAFLHEDHRAASASPDTMGAALFAVAMASLMFLLGQDSLQYAFLALLAFSLSSLAFIWQERRAPDPMISLHLWTARPIAARKLVDAVFKPGHDGRDDGRSMFVQVVLQRSATVAGFALNMMTVGWPTGATLVSKLFIRVGLRRQLVGGIMFVPLGALIFVFVTPESSPVWVGLGSAVLGFGMGVLSVSALILIQDSVLFSERGSATASNLFSRNLENTLGAALLGVVQSANFTSRWTASVSLREVRQLLEGSVRQSSGLAAVRHAMHHSLHLTFLPMFVLALLACAAMLLLPRRSLTVSR